MVLLTTNNKLYFTSYCINKTISPPKLKRYTSSSDQSYSSSHAKKLFVSLLFTMVDILSLLLAVSHQNCHFCIFAIYCSRALSVCLLCAWCVASLRGIWRNSTTIRNYKELYQWASCCQWWQSIYKGFRSKEEVLCLKNKHL